MAPGDVLFFHCNTLHRSDQNKSKNSRWSMICSYNAARNDPYKESQHPRYTKLVKVPDSRIREYGEKRFTGDEGSEVWLADERDTTFRNLPR
jgi:ectoine hydroxylase-related dioxygenase (phytanoyl-CoA dioxygenase family)